MEVGKEKGQRPSTSVMYKESEGGRGKNLKMVQMLEFLKETERRECGLLLPSECLGQCEEQAATCSALPQTL